MSPGAPCKCPNCESEKITYTEMFDDCTIEVGCHDCSCRWIELYRFIGIEVSNAGERPQNVKEGDTHYVD